MGQDTLQTLYHCIQVAKEAMICQGITSPYLISSNSPSGGIKLIARSVSNLLSLTHCKQTREGLKRFSSLPTRKYRYKRRTIVLKINHTFSSTSVKLEVEEAGISLTFLAGGELVFTGRQNVLNLIFFIRKKPFL